MSFIHGLKESRSVLTAKACLKFNSFYYLTNNSKRILSLQFSYISVLTVATVKAVTTVNTIVTITTVSTNTTVTTFPCVATGTTVTNIRSVNIT